MTACISSLLGGSGIMPQQTEAESARQAAALGKSIGMEVYPRSITAKDGLVFFLAKRGVDKFLCVASKSPAPDDFGAACDRASAGEPGVSVTVFRADHAAVEGLRKHLPFLSPCVFGVKKAVGLGDRLGLATPGHVRAVRGSGVAPYFAQQSIREMTRTRRTPDEVMDTAAWGVFQEGWRDGFGSDADHLKTTDDVDLCLKAGFTFYTVDPGDHVDNDADGMAADVLARKFDGLPWAELETTAGDCCAAYADKTFDIGAGPALSITRDDVLRAAVKYGRAVAHAVKVFRHLSDKMGDKPFELEMSVDETASPTTVPDHFFVASELKRLGVRWVSLAPRFIGAFEKGVDYKGDLKEYEKAFIRHVAIAKHLGPYKISLHSGSDKFSVYPIAAMYGGELVHVKTAGTSYLEALRAIGAVRPGLFREILTFAFERYDEDKASYHVSADPSKVPSAASLDDDELPAVLDLFDGRQLLHVTYGSVLTAKDNGGFRFRDHILAALRENEEVHYAVLEKHLGKHVGPFRRL